jgi:choline-sulfatase
MGEGEATRASAEGVRPASGSRPHIVLVMADQLAAPFLPIYGHPVVRTPTLSAFAQQGVVFDAAYCNFPICAPSRASMLAGRMPHALEVWDNASEFRAEVPTMAHYLAAAGYRTVLAGKMHFVGPDQLHGYHERLTTDIYPAEFLWVPDWSKGPGHKPTGVGMGHVVDAGPSLRNMQIDYDEEVAHVAVQRIWDLARADSRGEAAPHFLTVSFTHPHPPFVAPQEHWARYAGVEIDPPRVPEIPYAQLDPHSQWLYLAHGQDRHAITAAHVREARRAYYAMASYVDEKIGQILHALDASGLGARSLVVFCADHGEMMGERGMWFKQTFYEPSVRVPLVARWPGVAQPGRRAGPCSLVDLLPTFLDAAAAGEGGVRVEPVDALDGRSLLPVLQGEPGHGADVLSEYSSEGVCAPSRMLRRGSHKLVSTLGLPPMLFDLERDPLELHDLASEPAYDTLLQTLQQRLVADWDAPSLDTRIRASQRRRLFLRQLGVARGEFPAWSWEARPGDRARFVRPATAGGPVGPKPRMRFPFVPPTPPDKPPRA